MGALSILGFKPQKRPLQPVGKRLGPPTCMSAGVRGLAAAPLESPAHPPRDAGEAKILSVDILTGSQVLLRFGSLVTRHARTKASITK